jgi:hypothetical protein
MELDFKISALVSSGMNWIADSTEVASIIGGVDFDKFFISKL